MLSHLSSIFTAYEITTKYEKKENSKQTKEQRLNTPSRQQSHSSADAVGVQYISLSSIGVEILVISVVWL